MTAFRMAHAADDSVDNAISTLCNTLGDLPSDSLGLVYLNRAAGSEAKAVLSQLGERYPKVRWSGAAADAVIAGELELGTRPALAVMVMPLPAGSWQAFSPESPLRPGIHTALVHADPAAPDLSGQIGVLAERTQTGYLFGGLTSGDPLRPEQFSNGEPLRGGLSGVGFDEQVRVLSRVTQGCSPLAGEHEITECNANYLKSLDGKPALDVMLRDLGVSDDVLESRDGEELLRALPSDRLRNGLLVGLNDAIQDRSLGFGDYMVRNLIGIDPENRLVAIGAEPSVGDRIVFCTRDREAARADLIRVCTELRDEVESESLVVNGAHFVSCVARGESLFGAVGAETALLKHNIGDIPIIGFYANGEIARERLYGYTAVVTLFVQPDKSA